MRICAVDADRERDLQRRCERALTTAARAAGLGTRQQIRAAARGFVRRHRRDRSYLTFVLRGVLANSALAIALLGLAPTPADAAATLFVERTGAANPLDNEDVGYVSAPAAGDLDGDGDLDVVAGETFGTFFYYENTGSATLPAFVLRTGSANPFVGLDVVYLSAPTLGDLDGDGDLDLISGEEGGAFFYFENTGSATVPAFALRTGSANPLDGQNVGANSVPALGDLDGDGDLDLVSGEGDFFDPTIFNYYENTGSATSPAFIPRTGSANPVDLQDVGVNFGDLSLPALGDLDGDGDLDLVSGEYTLSTPFVFNYYENTGSATSPAFIPRTGSANPLGDGPAVLFARPVLGDLDGDGNLDLISGERYGRFLYYENLAGAFVPLTGAANPLDGQNVGVISTPAAGDLDGDGDLDLVAGEGDGVFNYYENTGSAMLPAFVLAPGSANPLNGQDAGIFSVPALGDLDGDGDFDLVSGEYFGTFRYYENTGSATVPAFVERTGSANPLNGQDVGYFSFPGLGDVDGDGDLDLASSALFSLTVYYENTGSTMLPAFVERTGSANPLNVAGSYGAPAFGDVDGDGDLDVVEGLGYGTFLYFENTGSATVPAYAQRTGSANPLDGQDVGDSSVPALGDLDGDGDLDLVAGEYDGVFNYFENAIVRPVPRYVGPIPPPFTGVDIGYLSSPAAGDVDGDGDPDFIASFGADAVRFFENTGSAIAPKVVERTGSANPFNGLDVGNTDRLVLGDLDRDGDLDLVTGATSLVDSARYFENTGTATGPVYVQRTGAANPFAAVSTDFWPALGDLDGDGDLDLVSGEYSGAFRYYENTGSASVPAFAQRTGSANPLHLQDVGVLSVPVIGDLDGDGDLDLVAGEAYGTFGYFENTGTVTAPAFVQRTGPANPLDGKDVGLNAYATFVDLDADSDLDLVSGERYGALIPFYLPEPAAPLALGAGAGLLAWLRRWRRITR